tara:strand:+ start:967 stop:1227 length:261 start_codon:yes stop_codon:yes gene_type:complete
VSGWDDLDEAPTVAREDQKQIDLNVLMARTFGSEDGEKVLAWMRKFYLEQPCWQPGAESSFGQWREGQNTVVRDIEARIRKAKSNG